MASVLSNEVAVGVVKVTPPVAVTAASVVWHLPDIAYLLTIIYTSLMILQLIAKWLLGAWQRWKD